MAIKTSAKEVINHLQTAKLIKNHLQNLKLVKGEPIDETSVDSIKSKPTAINPSLNQPSYNPGISPGLGTKLPLPASQLYTTANHPPPPPLTPVSPNTTPRSTNNQFYPAALPGAGGTLAPPPTANSLLSPPAALPPAYRNDHTARYQINNQHQRFSTHNQQQQLVPPERPNSYESGYESSSTIATATTPGLFTPNSDTTTTTDGSALSRLFSTNVTYSSDAANDIKGLHHSNIQHQGYVDYHQPTNLHEHSLHHLPSLLSPQASPVDLNHPHQHSPVVFNHMTTSNVQHGNYILPNNNAKSAANFDSSGEEDDLLDAIAEWQQE